MRLIVQFILCSTGSCLVVFVASKLLKITFYEAAALVALGDAAMLRAINAVDR